jgi:Amt family ammonium transporter
MLRDIVLFTVLGLAMLFGSIGAQEAVVVTETATAVTEAASAEPAYNMVDTLWVLVAGFLVFFMNAGFAFLEAGFCRAKNVVNILAKNFLVFAMASLAFWAMALCSVKAMPLSV